MKLKASVLGALLFVFSLSSFAKDTSHLFDELRDTPANYEVVGTVCEEVAAIELREDYPEDQYHIEVGIVYADQKRVIGELDIVVFDKKDKMVQLVAEVKCWKNLNGARQKAENQRQRFINTLKTKSNFKMYDEEQDFSPNQFRGNTKYIAISQMGGEKAGFERSLPYTLQELMELRKQLIGCQHQGQCARPK